MAKAKAEAKKFDGEVSDFADALGPTGPETRVNDDGEVEHVRGPSLQADIETIRTRRAGERAVRGRAGKRRRITNYVDAERLRNLHGAGHTHLISTEELVDCEEEGFFNLDGVVTASDSVLGPDKVPNGTIAPPQAPTPAEDD
jgi:hypothetical protein